MKIKILCTLGPASLKGDVIERLDELDVDLFRINLSHTPLDAVEDTIEYVRRHSSVPICLDTEGAQVRCGEMKPDVVLEAGADVTLTPETVLGDRRVLTLWPGSVFAGLRVGSVVGLDFDGVELRVSEATEGHAIATVMKGGRVRSNKGSTVEPPVELPALTEKDVAAVQIGAARGLMDYALSFARCPGDIAELRTLAPAGAHVLAKIESRAGINEMDAIIPAADAVLIDRGDLSKEVPVEQIPYCQKAIVRHANRWHRPVYVATNLLESMVTNKTPTVAEANDIANSLLDGVHGLVLAAETAIGIDPAATVELVRRAIGAFEGAIESHVFDQAPSQMHLVA